MLGIRTKKYLKFRQLLINDFLPRLTEPLLFKNKVITFEVQIAMTRNNGGLFLQTPSNGLICGS